MPPNERTEEQAFSVTEFFGYYKTSGGDELQAPPGSFTDASKNIVVDSGKKLKKSFGASRLSTATAEITQPFWWRRSRGGDVCIVEANGSLRRMTPPSPQGLWSSLPGDSSFLSSDARDRTASFVAFGDWLFFCNGVDRPVKVRRHDFRTYTLGLDPPEASILPTSLQKKVHISLGGSGLKFGVYKYLFTFVYRGGGESNPNDDPFTVEVPGDAFIDDLGVVSSALNPEQIARCFVDIGDFPDLTAYASLRDDIEGINVYRTQADGGVYFFVGRVERGYKYFTDRVPDSLLGGAIPVDHDLPPVCRFFAEHDGRLFALGDVEAGAGDVLRISERGNPNIFPRDFSLTQPELVNAGRGTGLKSIGGILYVLFERAYFRLDGSRIEDYTLVPIATSFGAVAPNTVRVYEDALVMLTQHGITISRGTSWQTISLPIDFDLDEIHWQDIYNASAVIYGDYYILSFPASSDNDAVESRFGRTFVINLANGAIGTAELYFDFATDDGPLDRPLVSRFTSNTDQTVFSVGWPTNKGMSDGASDYLSLAVADFHWSDFGSPQHEKELNRVVLDVVAHGTGGLQLTITDEYGTVETKVFNPTVDVPLWGVNDWSAVEFYPAETKAKLTFRPKKLAGRRFKYRFEELGAFGSPFGSLQVRVDGIHSYYQFRKNT